MGQSRYSPGRAWSDRGPGPAPDVAGDGQEGAYSAVLASAPTNSTVKVTIPALGLTYTRTALCSASYAGSVGDRVLVLFDEQKNPWVIATTV